MNGFSRWKALLLAPCFCVPLLFGVEDEDLMNMSLNELLNMEIEVEVASKNAEKIWDAPGVISVINANEISQFGAINLIDLLNRVASVYMLNSYFSPNNFASVRGDSQSNYDNHVLLLLNGRPIRESMNGSFNAAIYQAFPIAALKRIEIIRGPGSALYGANAYAGVINLVTGGDAGTRVEAIAGNYDALGGQVSHIGSWKGLEFQISAEALADEGWDFNAVDEAGVAQSINYGEENYSFLATLDYKDWSLSAFGVNSTYDYWGTTPVGPGVVRDLSRYFANLGWKKGFGDLTLETNLTYNGMDVRDGMKNTSEDLLLEFTGFYKWGEKANLVFGMLADHTTGSFEPVIPTYDRTGYSMYFQGDFRPVDKIKLIAGGQFNRPDGGDTDFVPRLGLVGQFSANSGVKLLYGEAFRSPAAVETDFQAPPVILGNPDLVPETVASTEVQFYYEGKDYQVAGTYFHTEQQSLIGREFSPGGPALFVYQNLGSGDFQGLEFEGKYAPSESLYTTFSATYQENDNQDGVEGFTTLPKFMAKVGVVGRLGAWGNLGVFDSYFADAEGVRTTNPEAALVNPPADAFHLVSANLELTLRDSGPGKGLKFEIFSQNLLDEDIYQPEFVRRRINTIPVYGGRSVFGKVSWTF